MQVIHLAYAGRRHAARPPEVPVPELKPSETEATSPSRSSQMIDQIWTGIYGPKHEWEINLWPRKLPYALRACFLRARARLRYPSTPRYQLQAKGYLQLSSACAIASSLLSRRFQYVGAVCLAIVHCATVLAQGEQFLPTIAHPFSHEPPNIL